DQWTIGDFNGDGTDDVYFWWRADGANRLYLSNGNGSFTQTLDPIARGLINAGDRWAIGDFDRNGTADVYFWWKGDGTNRLYLSNGNGSFTQILDPVARGLINAGDRWRLGDFNADGAADVLFY